MSRGVIHIVWGYKTRVRAALPRSIDSLKKWHPELEHRVIEMPDASDLRCKAKMYDLSPFDETLYLDVDTVVLGRLDFGFKKAKQHGIALCVNVNPWARRYVALSGHTVEYDTGVLFFSKKWMEYETIHGFKPREVFDAWKANESLDSESLFLSENGVASMAVNDQCGFAAAIESTGFNPFVLPVNWNLHPRWQKTFFGEVKIWHDYNEVAASLDVWNAGQSEETAVINCGQIQ